MKSAVEWMEDTIDKKHMGEYLQSVINQAKEIEVNLAQQYAEFSILCDRREMNPIKFKDWLKQYNEKIN
jgi:hypothetical protein